MLLTKKLHDRKVIVCQRNYQIQNFYKKHCSMDTFLSDLRFYENEGSKYKNNEKEG